MIELAANSLLILEDNEAKREGLATILSRQCYSIRGVSSSGQEPMERANLLPMPLFCDCHQIVALPDNQVDHMREARPSRDTEMIGVCRGLAHPDRLSPTNKRRLSHAEQLSGVLSL